MTVDELVELFELADDNYEGFKAVPASRRLSNRRDLHAFLLLDQLVPGKSSRMVAAAEHDEIFLDVDLETLAAVITPEQVADLMQCGVGYAEDSLSMFV